MAPDELAQTPHQFPCGCPIIHSYTRPLHETHQRLPIPVIRTSSEGGQISRPGTHGTPPEKVPWKPNVLVRELYQRKTPACILPSSHGRVIQYGPPIPLWMPYNTLIHTKELQNV